MGRGGVRVRCVLYGYPLCCAACCAPLRHAMTCCRCLLCCPRRPWPTSCGGSAAWGARPRSCWARRPRRLHGGAARRWGWCTHRCVLRGGAHPGSKMPRPTHATPPQPTHTPCHATPRHAMHHHQQQQQHNVQAPYAARVPEPRPFCVLPALQAARGRQRRALGAGRPVLLPGPRNFEYAAGVRPRRGGVGWGGLGGAGGASSWTRRSQNCFWRTPCRGGLGQNICWGKISWIRRWWLTSGTFSN